MAHDRARPAARHLNPPAARLRPACESFYGPFCGSAEGSVLYRGLYGVPYGLSWGPGTAGTAGAGGTGEAGTGPWVRETDGPG